MKTIKLRLLILLIPITINLHAQNIQRFLGTYPLEGMCEEYFPGYVFPDKRDVIITEGIESDLLINIGASAGLNDFKTFISNDSLFLPLQGWDNFDNIQAWLQRKGKLENDTLFLNYITSGSFGVIECECKGKKAGSTGILYPFSTDKNKTYYNIANQAIVLDETLRNQSLRFELLDLRENTILKKTNTIESINIANLPNGMYLCRILQNGRMIYSDRILKNKP